MEGNLEERFKTKIKESNFSIFEITGFQRHPSLALLAGMAMGYQMALEDYKAKINSLYQMGVAEEKQELEAVG